jgi:hypothetical protein
MNAFTARSLFYRDTAARRRSQEEAASGAERPTAEAARVALHSWVQQHRPDVLHAPWHGARLAASMWELDWPGGVNWRTFAVKLLRGRVVGASEVWAARPRQLDPRITPADAVRIVTQWLAADGNLRQLRSVEAPLDVAGVFDDAFDVGRLVHLVWAEPVWHRPRTIEDNEPVRCIVDAVTGEPLLADKEVPVTVATMRDHLEFRVAGAPFLLHYPPRLVAGRAYLYSGYLSSSLWRGTLTTKDGAMDGCFRGRSYRFAAGQTTGHIDGAPVGLPVPPLELGGECYLPTAAVELVTGWSLALSARQRLLEAKPPKGTKWP